MIQNLFARRLRPLRLSAAAALLAAIAAATLSAPGALAQARNIYGDPGEAHAEVRAALAKAAAEHKHVILDFGGNWCGDCQVLDIYFHKEPNAALLADNYILVDINVGHFDQNQDLAAKYDIPLHKGVPALAVLDGHGHLLYSQANGEFESMRRMDPNSVTEFLQRWKPHRN